MKLCGFILPSSDLWLLGICGALIMALIGFRFALNMQKRNAFNKVATEFRKILNEQASIINKVDDSYFAADILFSNTVEPYLKKSQITITGFRIYLKGSQLNKFDGAWKQYCEAQNKQEYLDAIATLYKLSKPK